MALYDIYNEENDMLFGVSGWKLREFARDCEPIDDLLSYKQGPSGSRSALYKNLKPTERTKEDHNDQREQPAPFTPR